jgi:hypothetical protein
MRQMRYERHTNRSGMPPTHLSQKSCWERLGACLLSFFMDGFKSRGFKCSYLNQNFVRRVMGFTHANLDLLRLEQVRIKAISGVHYPLMKLVDMYFWQIGYEQSPEFDDSREEVPGEP